jgi:hypothetical protein
MWCDGIDLLPLKAVSRCQMVGELADRWEGML